LTSQFLSQIGQKRKMDSQLLVPKSGTTGSHQLESDIMSLKSTEFTSLGLTPSD
jgi:hypothetical protein